LILAERGEAIRALYVQARNSTRAAAVVTVYLLITAWPYNPVAVLGAWLTVQLLSQVARAVLLRRFAMSAAHDTAVESWALAYTIYMAAAGLIWGSTAFLFMHPAQPITIALTLCGLYGISSGSVPGNAYNPPGLIVFVTAIFACVAIRLIAERDFDLTVLAIASCGFAAILTLFNREQHQTILQGIRIRFENRELLAELTDKTREAEDALLCAEQASLAKSQFLAAASHDLRQPLYALSLFSDSLGSFVTDERAQSIVASIQRNIDAMESLFNGLLDVSKLEAGSITVSREAMSVDALLQRIEHVFGATAIERGIDLRLRSNGEWVHSDAALLEQILSNLVSNAIRHTAHGGILVAARSRGDSIRFEVWDTGCGIPDADRVRIFDEFVQLTNPERDRRKGLGLGLAIARRAAHLLDTRVCVRSRVGRGSVFVLTQPRGSADGALRPVLLDPGNDIASSLRVLVVDDEPDIRAALHDIFTRWGVACDVEASAASALALIDNGARYDVVLTDHRLAGDESGLALIRAIRGRYGAEPPAMAIITGDMDLELSVSLEREGVLLVHKPIRAAELRALLNHLGQLNRQ
jgi:signal transduction histidine kinase